ncbi:hypothetical protein B9Z65_6453 [Elsinoe australis]|uniref:Uncharacterized protein n=1 Tax=Elsinoe australis TaxID=40998 RepID=A0A2P8A8N8_9PEZI|nr:hypothetical protein B9Z65_6453 [Elsinoe australis]
MPSAYKQDPSSEEAMEDAAEYVAQLGVDEIRDLMRIVNFPNRRMSDLLLADHFELSLPVQNLIVQRQVVEQVQHHRNHNSWAQGPIEVPQSNSTSHTVQQKPKTPSRLAWKSPYHRGHVSPYDFDAEPERQGPVQNGRRRQHREEVWDWSDVETIESDIDSPVLSACGYNLSQSSEVPNSGPRDAVDLTTHQNQDWADIVASTTPTYFQHLRNSSPLGSTGQDKSSSGVGLGISFGEPDESLDSLQEVSNEPAQHTSASRVDFWLKRRRCSSTSEDDETSRQTPCAPRKQVRYATPGSEQERRRPLIEDVSMIDLTAVSPVRSSSVDESSDEESVDGSAATDLDNDLPCDTGITTEATRGDAELITPGNQAALPDTRSHGTKRTICTNRTSHLPTPKTGNAGNGDYMIPMPEGSSGNRHPPQIAQKSKTVGAFPNPQCRERSWSMSSSLRGLEEQEGTDVDLQMPTSPTPPPFDTLLGSPREDDVRAHMLSPDVELVDRHPHATGPESPLFIPLTEPGALTPPPSQSVGSRQFKFTRQAHQTTSTSEELTLDHTMDQATITPSNATGTFTLAETVPQSSTARKPTREPAPSKTIAQNPAPRAPDLPDVRTPHGSSQSSSFRVAGFNNQSATVTRTQTTTATCTQTTSMSIQSNNNPSNTPWSELTPHEHRMLDADVSLIHEFVGSYSRLTDMNRDMWLKLERLAGENAELRQEVTELRQAQRGGEQRTVQLERSLRVLEQRDSVISAAQGRTVISID